MDLVDVCIGEVTSRIFEEFVGEEENEYED
jgi:hypothetical protein